MRHALLMFSVILAALFSFAQQSPQEQSGDQSAQAPSATQPAQTQPSAQATKTQSGAPPAQRSREGCLVVKSIGSHAFRNVMLFGVAGALVSKQQYEVIDVVDYPAHVGQKFGNYPFNSLGG